MRAPPRRHALIVASVIAGLLVLLLGAWALDSAVLTGQVARNVRLDGVAIGGLSDSDLRVEVAEIADRYESTPVHLVTPNNIAADGGDRLLYDPANGYRDAYRRIWQRP